MYIHIFKVQGTTNFPLDMLRYDKCYPHEQVDVSNMLDDLDRDLTTVTLVHRDDKKVWLPTKDRWHTFGWDVIDWAPMHTCQVQKL